MKKVAFLPILETPRESDVTYLLPTNASPIFAGSLDGHVLTIQYVLYRYALRHGLT